MSAQHDRLASVLRAPPPPTFDTLTADELDTLATALEAALSRQSAELRAAADRSLQQLPRLLRGPVRKVLLG